MSKATRLIEYLLAVVRLRSTAVLDLNSYDKVLFLAQIPHVDGWNTCAWDGAQANGEWLFAAKPREPERPAIPRPCMDWLDCNSWNEKLEEPMLRDENTIYVLKRDWTQDSNLPREVKVVQQLALQNSVTDVWHNYLQNDWHPWRKKYNAWENAKQIYEELFAIHQQLQKQESLELVLGLGLLKWQTPNGDKIRRHLIVANAALEFNAAAGVFTVGPAGVGAKLRVESEMLGANLPANAANTARIELEKADGDPWNRACVDNVLKTIVQSVDPNGTYDPGLPATDQAATSHPVIEYAPALILRERSTRGVIATLEAIQKQLETSDNDGVQIPHLISLMAEIAPIQAVNDSPQPARQGTLSTSEVYFPKSANDEQRQIVERLSHSKGVLVQGPPGTGKSHTIANLICHLLATGQRILITAKTPRALQVLAGLLPQEIRPLCVSLVGEGQQALKAMNSSIEGIVNRDSVWNKKMEEQKRSVLEGQLKTLRSEQAQDNNRLQAIREAEVHPHTIAGNQYRGTAAQIAKDYQRDYVKYAWFSDSVSWNQTCPFTTQQLLGVRQGLSRFTDDKRRELAQQSPTQMPAAGTFAQLVRQDSESLAAIRQYETTANGQLAAQLARGSQDAVARLQAALEAFTHHRQAVANLRHFWVKDAIQDIVTGQSTKWHQLRQSFAETVAELEPLIVAAEEQRLEVPPSTSIRALHKDARKLAEYAKHGGKLGWWIFRPRAVKEWLLTVPP